MSLKIGNVELANNIILAPMAGVSDLPFRLLCKEQGAGLVYTEMISAKAIYYGSKGTEELMEIRPEEGPVSLQLFGSDADLMAEMAKRVEEKPFTILDLNMGCPVPKVVNNHEGSALMKNPKLVAEIITKVAKAIEKPLTIKIRKGFDSENCNAVEIAHIAEECGAAAVAVHGRTREEYYRGKADWDCIGEVKEKTHIPIIGNGDICSAMDAKRMLEQTGCDGIMIGRGTEGNPWIFHEINEYLKTGVLPARPDSLEYRRMIKKHCDLQVDIKGEYIGVREMRKHLSWYTVGLPHSAKLRQMINSMEHMKELLSALDVIFPV